MSYLIILDTNVIFRDFFFKSANMKKLLKYVSSEPIDLCFTRFNYHEIIKKYTDEIRPLIKAIKRQKDSMIKLEIIDLVNTDKLNTELYIDEYKKFLDGVIEEHGIKIIDFPSSKDVTKKISEKYFNNIKPFDENKQSFQDAIMWESIVEYCEISNPDIVAFISDNHKDFSTREKTLIHEHLKSDVNNLIYFNSLGSFLNSREYELKEYFIDSFKYDENLIQNRLYHFVNSDDLLQGIIDDLLSNSTFSGEYLEGWGSFGYINDFIIEITNVTLDIDGQTLLISFDVITDVSFEIESINPIHERGDFGDGMLHEDSTANILVRSDITYSVIDRTFSDFINLDTQLIEYTVYPI